MKLTEYELGELLIYEQPTAYIVNSTEYSDSYKTPVLTAGKSFILGYTNETDNIFDKLPVIIFDDFTTATQFVNFKFKVKSSAMKILNVNTELVDPKYIFYRMQIIQFDHSTHKRYWIQQYSKIKVLIPPKDEQERIVSKIESLLSELDNTVETLEITKKQLELYRQAVLNNAFEGNYLEKQLKEISKVISGYAFKSSKYTPDGEYTIVKIGNVKQYYFDFTRDLTRTNEINDSILDKYLLQKGDCLITMTGSRGKRDYGFVSMINDESNYLINQRVSALRFDDKIAVPDFYKYYLSSSDFRTKFFSYETGNVGQGNVGVKALKEPFVICPTKDEQKNIVINIESKLITCKQLEKIIEKCLTQTMMLRKSILKQAFEGRL